MISANLSNYSGNRTTKPKSCQPSHSKRLVNFSRESAHSPHSRWTCPKARSPHFLDPMGAGKTTAIKLMRGLDSPTEGEITVRGTSSKKLGAKEFESIGYVSENHNLPLWMSVQCYLDFCRPLYPGWDAELEALLVSIPHSSESFPSEELMAPPFDSPRIRNQAQKQKKHPWTN